MLCSLLPLQLQTKLNPTEWTEQNGTQPTSQSLEPRPPLTAMQKLMQWEIQPCANPFSEKFNKQDNQDSYLVRLLCPLANGGGLWVCVGW